MILGKKRSPKKCTTEIIKKRNEKNSKNEGERVLIRKT